MRNDLNDVRARTIEQKNEKIKRYLQDRNITMRELVQILKERDEIDVSSRFYF